MKMISEKNKNRISLQKTLLKKYLTGDFSGRRKMISTRNTNLLEKKKKTTYIGNIED